MKFHKIVKYYKKNFIFRILMFIYFIILLYNMNSLKIGLIIIGILALILSGIRTFLYTQSIKNLNNIYYG